MRYIVYSLILGLAACGGGGSGNTGTSTPTQPATPNVTINGTISFDKVPQTSINNGALNYNAITVTPARGIVVEALTAANAVQTSTTTDTNGNYSLDVPENTNIRIRAKAQLLSNQWNFQATDNTNGNSLYVLDGSLADSGDSNSQRNLHAASGWTGTAYTQTRAAAPFAMLDVIYDGIQQILVDAPQTQFPAAEIRWSDRNRTSSGSLTSGDIGTSFYSVISGVPSLYILGAASSDTDEYDEDIIAHEWGHYVEDQLSRSESIGGPHSGSDFLDIRIAFSEGFGNAFSGIINGDSFYVDSFGANQSSAFSIDIENGSAASPNGWFNEDSVMKILYDVADTNNEGQDTLSLGMGGVVGALTHDSYKNSAALTSIFTYSNAFKNAFPNSGVGLDNLLTDNGVNTDDEFGTGETNRTLRTNGDEAAVLPVYTSITPNGVAINLCSTKAFGEINKLANFRFIRLDIATTGTYTLQASRTSGPTVTDPDFIVYNQGTVLHRAQSELNNSEVATVALSAGTYSIALNDFRNTDSTNSTGGTSCFNFTVN